MGRIKENLNNKKGASIIYVLIITAVFLIIGASVLTAASVSAGNSIKNRDNKQLYYYAKSACDLINKSVQDDEGLGLSIINILSGLMIEDRDIPSNVNLSSSIDIFDDSGFAYEGLSFNNVVISLSGVHCEKDQSYTQSDNYYYDIYEQYRIRISKVTISFIANYRDLEYKINLEYGFNASGYRTGSFYTMDPVNSIRDLDLSVLPRQVIWSSNNRSLMRVSQDAR